MKIKNLILILPVFLTMTGCTLAQQVALPTKQWNATVKIVGENGLPISGANVSVAYTKPPYAFSDEPEYHGMISGTTDDSGVFSATHADRTGMVGFSANKQGYYQTRWAQALRDPSENASDRNISVTLTLEKIGKPIAMYARNAQIEIPVLDKPVGFDLMEYAWVTPYGNGKQSDIVFEAHRQWVSRRDFDATVKITFSKQGDGLLVSSAAPAQGSSGPQMPVMAPLDSYNSEHQVELSHTPIGGWKDDSKKQNYYLRVRTALNPDDTVKSALYGKIYGGFTLDPINSKTTLILFTYYLNATPNDCNTEFDPSRNLFENLPSIQQAKNP